MYPLIFIRFLSYVFRNAKLNGFYQNVEDVEQPQDQMFFLVFMSAILANDNFMRTWFSITPRRLCFGIFLENVIRELTQRDSIGLILSKLENYLRVTPRIDYATKTSHNWTEEEISVWKLAIIYFLKMFVFKSLSGPRFLNIRLTEDLLRQLDTEFQRYKVYDPKSKLRDYFEKRASIFWQRLEENIKQHDFLELRNPLRSQLGFFRLRRDQILNFCNFCKKEECTRCKLCHKHDCGCCKQCKTPDSCCKLCRLCTSCSQHDHAICRKKLSDASEILCRFAKKVSSMARKRSLSLKAIGDYCYVCKRGQDRRSFTCFGKGVLRCGHHFCVFCTKQMINRNDRNHWRTLCPLCITPIGDGHRDIVWTKYNVKLNHRLILTTRKFFLARERLSVKVWIRVRIDRLVRYDRGITIGKCVVCLENFKDPRILPCGHVLCHECINQLDPKKCPSCRKDFMGFFDPSTNLIKFIFGTRYQLGREVYLCDA